MPAALRAPALLQPGRFPRHEPSAPPVHRGPGPDAMLGRPGRQPAAGVRPPARRPPPRCAGRLPARAVPHPVLLPGRGRLAVRPGRADPRPDHRGPGRGRARDPRWSSSARSSSGARRGSITTRRSSSTPTARSPAVIARCTSPTTRSITRSTTSRPATWASRRSRPRHARVGTLVCWDQWYPEAARLTALRGAEILFYPTAIGWHPAEKDEFGAAQSSAWETIQRSHAIANGVYVAAVNRVGHEGPVRRRPGILGRLVPGRPLRPHPRPRRARHRGNPRRHLRPPLQEETRRNWPFLRDRRIDAYAPITQRFLDG